MPDPRIVPEEQEHHLQENFGTDEGEQDELQSAVHDSLLVRGSTLRLDVRLPQDHYLHLELPDVPSHAAQDERQDGHVQDGESEEAQVIQVVQLVRQREHDEQDDAGDRALELGDGYVPPRDEPTARDQQQRTERRGVVEAIGEDARFADPIRKVSNPAHRLPLQHADRARHHLEQRHDQHHLVQRRDGRRVYHPKLKHLPGAEHGPHDQEREVQIRQLLVPKVQVLPARVHQHVVHVYQRGSLAAHRDGPLDHLPSLNGHGLNPRAAGFDFYDFAMAPHRRVGIRKLRDAE